MSVQNRLNTQPATGTGPRSAALALGAAVNRKVVLIVTSEHVTAAVTSPEYNGIPMTAIGGEGEVRAGSGDEYYYSAYYDVPDATAPGSYNVGFTISAVGAESPIHAWQLRDAAAGVPTIDGESGTTTTNPAISALSGMDILTAAVTGSGGAVPTVTSAEVTLTEQAEVGGGALSSRMADGVGDASETVTAAWSGGSSGINAILIGVAAAVVAGGNGLLRRLVTEGLFAMEPA